MIKIAYLIDTLSCDTSGTEKQLLEIISRLDRDRFSPHLICLYKSDWMRENTLPCSCSVLQYTGLLKWTLPGVLAKLRSILKEQDIHILQTFFEDSIFVAWLATRFLSSDIVLLSSRRDVGLGDGNRPWYHRLYGLVLPLVNRGFDGIVANSNRIRQYTAHREQVPKEKIKVIYNGVDVPKSSNSVPTVFSRYSADCWIVMVASFNQVKRHNLLVHAVSSLVRTLENKKIKVLLLGKGPLSKRLQNMVAQEQLEEFFIFEGAVHNVSDYLQQCDIGILCSDREGLSNAILEYMACGLPVIATKVGGNTELVDETNGICVPPNDHEALAAALYELITDKERRITLGQAGRQKVKKYFSWQSSMQHLVGYYNRLLIEKGVIRDH